jgi:hypothetical protein
MAGKNDCGMEGKVAGTCGGNIWREGVGGKRVAGRGWREYMKGKSWRENIEGTGCSKIYFFNV